MSAVTATGRRKRARVMVSLSSNNTDVNQILVRGEAIEKYFDHEPKIKELLYKPFEASGKQGLSANLKPLGGGKSGQVDAAVLGLSRSLLKYFPEEAELRSTLKQLGFLRRDDREVERQKPGMKGARARHQWSKR